MNLSLRKKLKKIVVLLIIAVFLGTMIFYLYNLTDTKKDFSEKESDASEPAWVDERFGMGSGWAIALQMGTKYYLSWGNEVSGTSLNSFYKNGLEQLLYIGNVKNPKDDPCAGETVHFDGNGIPTCGGYKYIQTLATNYKNKYWSIGNEPDFYPYIPPQDYAKWYRAFYNEIKKYDKTANVSVGGNFLTMYEATYSPWGRPNLKNDPLFVNLYNSAPNDEVKKMLKQNAWLVLFREYHKQYFGSYPVVDYWNVHNYPNRYYKGIEFSYNGAMYTDAINDSKGQIDSILRYIEYIGDVNKPVWVTEFSIYDGEWCDTWQNCNANSLNNQTYMQEIVNYYVNNTNKRVTKWFWFYGGDMRSWGRNSACNIWYEDGNLSTVGMKYLSLAEGLKDSQPPTTISVTNLVQENTSAEFVYIINASDVGNSGLMEYCYGVDLKSKSVPDKWACVPWLASSYKLQITISDWPDISSKKLFVRVKDSSGNYSAVKTADLPLLAPQNLKFECVNGKGVFTWDVVQGASKYMIRINREPDSDWANVLEGDIADHNVTTNRYEVELQSNKNYVWWSVQGIKSEEVYPYSGVQTRKTGQFSCNPIPGGCTPNCAGRQCGSDGCTGSCGTCEGGKTCNASGQCVLQDATIDIDIDGIEGVSIGDYSVFVKDYLAYRRNNTYNERSDFVKSTPDAINMADYQAFIVEYLRLRRL